MNSEEIFQKIDDALDKYCSEDRPLSEEFRAWMVDYDRLAEIYERLEAGSRIFLQSWMANRYYTFRMLHASADSVGRIYDDTWKGV